MKDVGRGVDDAELRERRMWWEVGRMWLEFWEEGRRRGCAVYQRQVYPC